MTRREMIVGILVERGETAEEAARMVTEIERMVPTVPLNIKAGVGDREMFIACLKFARETPDYYEVADRAMGEIARLNKLQ